MALGNLDVHHVGVVVGDLDVSMQQISADTGVTWAPVMERAQRIRTADDTLLIVPNSNLTTMNVTNYGRRRYRRYETRIGVAYDTLPERLIAFRDAIGDAIRKHEHTRKDHLEVAVNDLAASAIEILVNVYFEVANRSQELAARDALILEILRLAGELNVELAFPTQTIHVVGKADPAGRSNSPESELAAGSLDRIRNNA